MYGDRLTGPDSTIEFIDKKLNGWRNLNNYLLRRYEYPETRRYSSIKEYTTMSVDRKDDGWSYG